MKLAMHQNGNSRKLKILDTFGKKQKSIVPLPPPVLKYRYLYKILAKTVNGILSQKVSMAKTLWPNSINEL